LAHIRLKTSTYSGEEFQEIVQNAIDLTDRLVQRADAKQTKQMHEDFVTSTRLEWMFWDIVYRMEQWIP
jgi:thiaminase (transcriptional activator TenA)